MTQLRIDVTQEPFYDEIKRVGDEYLALCKTGELEFSYEGLTNYQKEHMSPECWNYMVEFDKKYLELKKVGIQL